MTDQTGHIGYTRDSLELALCPHLSAAERSPDIRLRHRMLTRLKTLLIPVLVGVTLSASVSAQEYPPSHLEAAEELLIQVNTDELMDRAVDEMLQTQLAQNTSLEPFEDVMRDFFAEHLSWKAMREEMTRLYAATFTEEELREIAAFYRTPTGQKAIATMPDLMVQGMRLGQQAVQQHMPDLQRRVEQRVKELTTEG